MVSKTEKIIARFAALLLLIFLSISIMIQITSISVALCFFFYATHQLNYFNITYEKFPNNYSILNESKFS